MKTILLILNFLFYSFNLSANEVKFSTNDSATIYAEFKKRGSHAVLLAHGAIFNKESWGEFEQQLLDNNYTVLAIDFRGYGKSTKGQQSNALYLDILAGVEFLQSQPEISKISVLGASMGGAAAAKASAYAKPQSINQLILLSPASVYQPEKLKGVLLFIASKDEYLTKGLKSAYNKAPAPKTYKLIPGSAHAQHIFKTPQADTLTAIILDFLKN
ncbi:secreted protein containing Alpha/beta hydrolase fold-1 domain [methanotrophic bacterial endosymbiont of Bathymodiolus sp.]|jgi:pimeloyl-ACP methyl ester carboxylesterase|nr:secreted protein containing Alpha/beta hydrolase fold-1 domain [methanotrophic bacterial endosymbiont of Bathymodiolus sp.]